jgi:PAS domain S-box-containing protein
VAAQARARAAADRELAAADRALAAQERALADADREALLGEIVEDLARERTLISRLQERSALLELAPDPIFARDAQSQITFWNAAARRVYGFTGQEALGARPQDLLSTEYPIALPDIERFAAEHGIWEGDVVHIAKDGRRLTVTSRCRILRDPSGAVTGLLESTHDITERLDAQAAREQDHDRQERERLGNRLVRAQRLASLGELAGGIAHDFNNALAVIMTYSAVVATRLAPLREHLRSEAFDVVSEGVEEIAQTAQHAAQLTHQLLTFAAQDAERAAVTDVNATITATLDLLGHTLGRQITVATTLDPMLDQVRIDPGQLGQVLVNLAVNSRDAMPDGGQLSITTSRLMLDAHDPLGEGVLPAGRYARLDVTDTGTGMPADVSDRAFDPFFTTKPSGEGTGLGLSSVYGIITRAGGQVELVSEPGQGTTVTALLPASDAPSRVDPTARREMTTSAGSSATTTSATTTSATTTHTILVVEDEPALRAAITRSLTDAGYSAITAPTSTDALTLARDRDQPIDLLLTDIVMPGLTGQQLAHRLFTTNPALKVLFMSGYARPSPTSSDQPLPGPLLQKPFTIPELLASITGLLDDLG